MINSVILVGKLVSDPEVGETQNGKNVCEITLATKRPFKNATTHQYDMDYIKIVVWESLAINLNEYCKKGATVGIRARIQSRTMKLDNGFLTIPEIVGEQVVFISKGTQAKQDEKESLDKESSEEDLSEIIKNNEDIPL